MIERIVPLVESKFSAKITNLTSLRGGMNNQLYRLQFDTHPDVLAKSYYQDERKRLDREYSALLFFHKYGLASTPKPYFREGEDFAIYSFEQSINKKPEEVSRKEIDEMINFVSFMHGFKPSAVTEKFDDAIMPVFSFEQFFQGAQYRFNKFLNYATGYNVDTEVKNFYDSYDIESLVRSVEKKVRQVSGSEYNQVLDVEKRRLSPADFGIHNMLFRPDGNICFIDFEYFGWDDPARIISSFYFHDANSRMSKEMREYFISSFKANSPLEADVVKRIDMAMLLSSAEWIGTILWGLTPEKVSFRTFSDSQFDAQSYINGQILKLVDRIDDLNERLQ